MNVTLVKISDSECPVLKTIEVGDVRVGTLITPPEVGKCVSIQLNNNPWWKTFKTSIVIAVYSKTRFKTMNSIYEISAIK
jgi:hypothetical protein